MNSILENAPRALRRKLLKRFGQPSFSDKVYKSANEFKNLEKKLK